MSEGVAVQGRASASAARAGAPERFEEALAATLQAEDEEQLSVVWAEVQAQVRAFVLRPAKRVRPRLLRVGYELAVAGSPAGDSFWRFAVGVELLHTFMLVHDDVVDHSDLRRGAASLHRLLGPGEAGEAAALVAGDHLFARALELMLGSGHSRAAEATHYYLGVCRHTAVGQYLDLALARRPLADVTLFDALKVAHLKTAKYSFAAPLACGALLGGAGGELVSGLQRVGRLAGLAFQLADDLLGIFGDKDQTGKPAAADLVEGKRTLPLLVAYRRATAAERSLLERLGQGAGEEEVTRARDVVRRRGGEAATQRAIDRMTRGALKALNALDPAGVRTATLAALLRSIGRLHPELREGRP